jgi:uncharacterized protein YndB with AHSA1/START domain
MTDQTSPDQAGIDRTIIRRTVEQRVRIAASPETVWSFWTDAERLCQWWAMTAEAVPEPGGLLRVVMGVDGPVMSGRYVQLEPFRRLVFTFGWEGSPMGEALAPGATVVEVTLTPVGEDTDVVLRHSEVPVRHADEHAKGWALFVGERLTAAASKDFR